MDIRGSGFVAGMLAGIIIGGASAMLILPWSGDQTRDLLRAKSREASNLARDAAADALDGVRRTVAGAVAEGKTSAQRQRTALEQRIASRKQ